jgi:hypothetical protein
VIKQERLLLVFGACLALGAVAIDAMAQDEPEPLWAYAFSTPPKPDDKAIPQAAPTTVCAAARIPASPTHPR